MDKLLFSFAFAALAGLIVLLLARRLRTSTRDSKALNRKGTRKVLQPASTLPVIGNTWDVIRFLSVRHDWIASLSEEAKGEPILLSSWGTPDTILVSTPQALEDVLKDQFNNFPKGPMLAEYTREFLGQGIFAVDGSEWYRQRKTASKLFTTRALRDSMTNTIQRHLLVLDHIFHRAADTNESIDLFRLFNRFTMEVFTEIGFGVRLGCLDTEKEHPFQTAFDRSQESLILRFIRPTWFWKAQRVLGVGMEGQFQRAMTVINSTIYDIVTKRLASTKEPASTSSDQVDKDIISLFLDDMRMSPGEDIPQFDPSFLRDIVLNFIIAGRDTTAQALSWFFYCLSRNPTVKKKICEEILSKLPNLQFSPSMEEVGELVYVEAALKETLRLYPSVPLLTKEAAHDAVLSDGTFVPAGTILTLPFYAVGRMPHVWGADAAEFKPERWIDANTGKLISVSAYQFVTFHAGPRLCLGKNLAMLEMKLIVASLLSKYHVELESPEEVTYATSVTLPVKGPLLGKISLNPLEVKSTDAVSATLQK